MSAPLYPSKTWTCSVCGNTNPGDIGRCTRCWSGSISPRGGLYAGERPYFPAWHFRESDDYGEAAIADELDRREFVRNDIV